MTSQEDSNAEENIASVMMQEDHLHHKFFTRTLIKVCVMLHCSVLFCVQLGKHTVTEARVDHCKLPCVASDASQ